MRAILARFAPVVVAAACVGAVLTAQQPPPAQVSIQEIAAGLPADGSKWLHFGGNYSNHRHSPLTQITPDNVSRLAPQWTFQTGVLGSFQATPPRMAASPKKGISGMPGVNPRPINRAATVAKALGEALSCDVRASPAGPPTTWNSDCAVSHAKSC